MNASTNGKSCPSEQDLEAFNSARLPEGELVLIASHVSNCERCERVVSRLSDGADFLRTACRDGNLNQLFAEPEFQAMRSFDPTEWASSRTKSQSDQSSAPSPVVGSQIGKYIILGDLGSGGMGRVFKVRDPHLEVERALKVMKAGIFASESDRLRFERETKGMASVNQDHVVQVHAAELEHSPPYIVMEYVEGGSLSDHIHEFRDKPQAAVALLSKIATAVHAIHECNLLHRDLKPQNVLMDLDGNPKVSDFGLVKTLDPDQTKSMTEAEIGTLPYMAPEQTELITEEPGRETDVWALGVLLYQLITGSLPFRGRTRGKLRINICKADPQFKGSACRAIDRRLEAVLRKCLSRRKEDRYSTAHDLASDLENWLSGQPMVARPDGPLKRGLRYAARHRTAVAAVTLAVVTATAAFAFHPDRPLWGIQKRLEARQPVTLVAAGEAPVWHEALIGQPVLGLDADNDFTIRAWDMSLIDLVRDPQHAEFRFEAEVHHQLSDRLGEVGLFLLYKPGIPTDGQEHHFVRLAFNDVDLQRTPPHPGIVIPNSDRNPVAFGSRIRIFGDGPPIDHIFSTPLRSQFFTPGKFTSNGDKRWRQLRVEADHERVTAQFDQIVIGSLPHAEILNRLQRNPSRQENTIGSITSQSAVGLYVFRGTASFRNVIITPQRSTP